MSTVGCREYNGMRANEAHIVVCIGAGRMTDGLFPEGIAPLKSQKLLF
jgi:hypothetical protein